MKSKNLLSMIRNRKKRDQIYNTNVYWDSKADEYKGNAISMWPNNHLNRFYNYEQISVINEFFPTVAELDILDVGCGTGRISYYLAHCGARVTGLDFSAKAIELAKKMTVDNNPTFRLQSFFEIDDNYSFDIIISVASLTVACTSRQDLLNVIRRLHKALRPEGQLLLVEPINKGILHRVLDMDINEFCEVVKEGGFYVKKVRHLHFWPFRLLLAYIPWPNFITAPIYYLGEKIMSLMDYQSCGDYKAVYGILDQSDQK